MSFATLLNGYALNTSIRLTFSEPQSLVAGAQSHGAEPTRIVFAGGTATAHASSTGVSTRTAGMTPEPLRGEAVAPAVDAWRVTGMQARGLAASAQASGTSTRLAYLVPQPLTGMATASAFEPTRIVDVDTAPIAKDQSLGGLMLNGASWFDACSEGTAETCLASTTLATRPVTGDPAVLTGQAALVPLAYDLTRWMMPKPVRVRALSFAHEGRLTTLHTRQQYAAGTAIARAQTRGTPNTILAFSITYAEATLSLDQAKLVIARDSAPGRTLGEALAAGATAQDHAARGRSVATATGYITPDVTRVSDGVKYAYAWGKTRANAAVSTANAVRWPMVRGVRQPAEATLRVTQLIARDMTGRAAAQGASLSDPREAIVTHTVWMRGQAQARAEAGAFEPTALRKMDGTSHAEANTTGVPWHWVAVAANGVAQARAEAWGDNPRIYTDGRGEARAGAASPDAAYKRAYVTGRARCDGATLGEAANVTRHMTPVRMTSTATAPAFYPRVTVATQPAQSTGLASLSAQARNAAVHMEAEASHASSEIHLPWAEARGEVGARPLRRVAVTHVEPARAGGSASRNVFKINASDPAPDQRQLIVPFTDRGFVLAAALREYRV